MFFISSHALHCREPEAAVLADACGEYPSNPPNYQISDAHLASLAHEKNPFNAQITDHMVLIAHRVPPKITSIIPSPRCLSAASSQPVDSSPDVRGAHSEGFLTDLLISAWQPGL